MINIPKQKLSIKYDNEGEFTLELNYDNISGLTHTELRQAFLNFLRAVGYHIDDEEDLV